MEFLKKYQVTRKLIGELKDSVDSGGNKNQTLHCQHPNQ